MDNLFTLVLLGAVLFLMFRKSGMRFYGDHGHGHRVTYYFEDSGHLHPEGEKTREREPEIIDLSKDDYRILPDDEE